MVAPPVDPGIRTSADRADGFPFHDLAYARALTHLGEAETVQDLRIPVLRRPIPGTSWSDGTLPSPYVDPTPDEVAKLADALPELVSIVGVIRPGSTHRWSGLADVSAGKDHYVFEPTRPWKLSRRARRHLAGGQRPWRFELAQGSRVAAEAAAMHARVAGFRGFAGSSVDFPAVHFDQVAHAHWGVYFTAVSPEGKLGAVACGAVSADELHLLHLTVSREGLRSAASYVLMAGLTGWCSQSGRRMFLGSQPRTGTPGLARFKARWSNDRMPSHMIRVVVRPALYRSLCKSARAGEAFFPGYRSPG